MRRQRGKEGEILISLTTKRAGREAVVKVAEYKMQNTWQRKKNPVYTPYNHLPLTALQQKDFRIRLWGMEVLRLSQTSSCNLWLFTPRSQPGFNLFLNNPVLFKPWLLSTLGRPSAIYL